jgi:predicted ATPase
VAAAVLVGRERELEAIDVLIGGADGGASALLLEGEAGIGKTALWLEGVSRARFAGLTLLSARPGEGERGLPYAGLGDVVEPLLDGRLRALPTKQQDALEAERP